jgi:hypothetical protein
MLWPAVALGLGGPGRDCHPGIIRFVAAGVPPQRSWHGGRHVGWRLSARSPTMASMKRCSCVLGRREGRGGTLVAVRADDTRAAQAERILTSSSLSISTLVASITL